jgi:hypothetical protein
MMCGAKVPRYLWSEAINTTNYLTIGAQLEPMVELYQKRDIVKSLPM